MVISNRDAQRVLVHYEWLLRECPEVRTAVVQRGWHARVEQEACVSAIEGLIRLDKAGKSVL